MTGFFIKISTYGSTTPNIITEKVFQQAEQGKNYLNPDDYDFLCDAESVQEAEEFYYNKVGEEQMIAYFESFHP